ncbi:MAG: tRNA preQ1(34) S-adenosylmethionine ribosyltransferase-isomerase QueA [Firmicutes bacterium]|nr:tRNA preQ1(34) S-adenosylmethionine ribosyltransferase-isomerase QueA [Bacillota bacterium]
MQLEDFNYCLPTELIAQVPLKQRDNSRLLVLDRSTGALEHRLFWELPVYLRPGDLLVMNDTRVLPARLRGRRVPTGGKVELLLLKELESGRWEALVRPGRRCLPGQKLTFGAGGLRAQVLDRTAAGGRIITFNCSRSELDAWLVRIGEIPLPPYIRTQLSDPERYQTIYATQLGSVAAPTAGLHFSPKLLSDIKAMAVDICFITLAVGLGTFRPVKENNIKAHCMHKERYRINHAAAAAINKAKAEGRRIIAAGTTVVRTLEAAAVAGKVEPGERDTDLFIYPGFEFQIIDALITNFHLPKSTLLMLVAAWAGYENTMLAYREAVINKYRFFSFGDAMLIS